MLPWVGVQDDLESLEVVEGGTWADLGKAHRDLTSPIATPSGLENRHGAIPYRFPAAVELAGLGALPDALVCRRRWDSPQVLQERNVILGTDRSHTEEYVRAWQSRAERLAVEAFKAVEEAERAAFGSRSYFNRVERSRFLADMRAGTLNNDEAPDNATGTWGDVPVQPQAEAPGGVQVRDATEQSSSSEDSPAGDKTASVETW